MSADDWNIREQCRQGETFTEPRLETSANDRLTVLLAQIVTELQEINEALQCLKAVMLKPAREPVDYYGHKP